jgi:hypothetical protein
MSGTMNGSPPRLDLQFFPQQMLDLHREIQHHPPLLKLLHDQDNKDVYIQLMEIATYCEIVVIGTFTHQDILDLASKCTSKLYAMRTSIIIPFKH